MGKTLHYDKYAPRLLVVAESDFIPNWLQERNYSFIQADGTESDPKGAFPTMPFEEQKMYWNFSDYPEQLALLVDAHAAARKISEQGHPRIAAGPHTVIMTTIQREYEAGTEITHAFYQPDSGADASAWEWVKKGDLWIGGMLQEVLSEAWSINPMEEG